ncbi:MAG TPA: arginine deiminase family protein [Symbiobacteriaceae bacterium]|nr:arginine deiminase family protein [Symbiobacteriaceae bacterium]
MWRILTEEIRSVGERHFAKKTTFHEDLPLYWGNWGATSETGRLRAVLMRRPGSEIEEITDPVVPRWREVLDPETARQQHDLLAQAYRDHGVEVHYVQETGADRPNAIYCRDLLAMTPEGAIIARPAMDVRRGEERYVAATVAAMGVPIVKTINGTGTFEGADLIMIDRHSAFVGLGNRTNAEGARQVIEELRLQGVTDVTVIQVPYGVAHLDCMFGLASPDVAVVFPWVTPFVVCEKLMEKGYRIIEVQNPREGRQGYATNFVALRPGVVVMSAGTPETVEALDAHGVEVVEVDISEILKGMGGVHCCTAILSREDL